MPAALPPRSPLFPLRWPGRPRSPRWLPAQRPPGRTPKGSRSRPAIGPPVEVLPRLVRRPWRHLSQAVEALGDNPEDEALHEVRIRAKRLRYAAEAATPVIGKPAQRFASAVATLQGVLGDMNDAVVAEAWLRQSAEQRVGLPGLGGRRAHRPRAPGAAGRPGFVGGAVESGVATQAEGLAQGVVRVTGMVARILYKEVLVVRIAALDLGSNSFHLLVADAHPDGTFEPLVTERVTLRLADVVARQGRIGETGSSRGGGGRPPFPVPG